MVAGRYDIGGTTYLLAADTKRVSRINVPWSGKIAKASVYLDGLGGGLGAQVARAVVYDASNVLLAQGCPVTVGQGQAPGWVDFCFPIQNGEFALDRGDVFVGLHAGAYDGTIRLYGSGPHGMGGKWNADTYDDGASDPFGASTAVTSDLSLFLTGFAPYVAPDETEIYFSRLPFAEAQEIFARGGPEAGSSRIVDAGWHDTFTDPELGSNVLVREGSALEPLLGERIRVTRVGLSPTRAVYAYVHDLAPADFEWDLSLTRHLFGQLGMLAATTVRTVVEVIA